MKIIQTTIADILDWGVKRGNRTGTDTIQIPSMHLSFDLRKGTPMLTARKQVLKNVINEQLWFLTGSTNIDFLEKAGCPFWDEWATKEDVLRPERLSFHERMQFMVGTGKFKPSEIIAMRDKDGESAVMELMSDLGIPETQDVVSIPKGSVGPMYGYLMRNYPTSKGGYIDQIAYVIDSLRKNPLSRRHVVDVWCPEYLPDENFTPQENVKAGLAALAPCHFAFEFITEPMLVEERAELFFADNGMDTAEYNWLTETERHEFFDKYNTPKYHIDIKFHMRSNDVVLGLPANILGYSVMLMMIAQQVNMLPRMVYYTGSNVHVYENHLEGIKEWLSREPSKLPRLKIVGHPKDIDSYTVDNFELSDYNPQPHIKFQPSV